MQGWLGTACPSETKISNQTFLSMPSDITAKFGSSPFQAQIAEIKFILLKLCVSSDKQNR